MSKSTPPWRFWLLIITAWFIGFVLMGLCLRQAGLQSNAKLKPLEALKIDPDYATALGWAALKAVEEPAKESQQKAAFYAKLALQRDPLNNNALRVLGVQTATTGDRPGADGYFIAAQKRTKRDAISSLWILTRAIENNKPDAAITELDALMRTESADVIDPIAKIFVQSMKLSPAYNVALVTKLKTKPGWTAEFLGALARSFEDPVTSLVFFQDLKAQGLLEDAATIRTIVGEYVAKRHYDQARAAMTTLGASSQSLQPLMSTLTFEKSNTAFDWIFNQSGNSVLSGFEPATKANPGSLWIINSGDGGNLLVASKLMMLPSGAYQLTTTSETNASTSLKDFRWGVYCDQSGETLATSVLQNEPGAIIVNFVVPPVGCDGLFVRIYTNARDSLDRTEVTFVDPKIRRLSVAQVTAP